MPVIPLKEAARRNRPRVSQIELREIVPTKTQADELARIYLDVVRHWRNVGERVLAGYDPPALTTDSIPEVESALASGQTAATAVIASITPQLEGWAARLAQWHARKWAANVAAGTGVTIAQFLTNAAIADDLAASLAWNAGLIRNVSDSTRDRIANIVWAGWKNRTPRREIARQINEAVGIERRRALNIARDQSIKLSSSLDEARMLEAGLDEYIWRHGGSLNPRHVHVERDGKRYKVSTPPAGGPPGTEINCKCKRQVYLDLG